MSIQLITGIPRSGTTLCCHIINQQKHCVALHEPVSPSILNEVGNKPDCLIRNLHQFYQSIYDGQYVENGDLNGLSISNPVSDTQLTPGGKRVHIAERGKIHLPEYAGTHFSLVIKQNALFTAYLNELKKAFKMTCIVRNPVDVLLSWWTVSLPVSNGRLPAGENNCAPLKARLQNKPTLQRQLLIYRWFCQQFVESALPIIRYENIIQTNGQLLLDSLFLEATTSEQLSPKVRTFSQPIKLKLKEHAASILNLHTTGIYSKAEINNKLEQVIG